MISRKICTITELTVSFGIVKCASTVLSPILVGTRWKKSTLVNPKSQQGNLQLRKPLNQQGQWKAQSAKTPQWQQRQINKGTPKPTRAVEGSVGQGAVEGSVGQDTAVATKADQQGTTGSGKATNAADPDAEMRRVATGITRLKLAKTRISGAQKRKMAIQAAIAAGASQNQNFRSAKTENGNSSCDRRWGSY
ncbi:hypothetical protein QE152_g28433 [Popillia japonica]|uniref:Uncharacterized protein n=1 Tax=Popillia japonica TaxID=7064 RepID=A0AAW1JK33_POPJA